MAANPGNSWLIIVASTGLSAANIIDNPGSDVCFIEGTSSALTSIYQDIGFHVDLALCRQSSDQSVMLPPCHIP